MYAKQPFGVKIAQFQLDLSQAADTYGIAQASMAGDIEIIGASLYCTVVGATFTSVSIQDNTAAGNEIMGTTKGAAANFVATAIVPMDWNFNTPFHLAKGQYIGYTIAGATGSGTALLTVQYRPVAKGGTLDAA